MSFRDDRIHIGTEIPFDISILEEIAAAACLMDVEIMMEVCRSDEKNDISAL